MAKEKDYQFRHIFFACAGGVLFVDSGAIRTPRTTAHKGADTAFYLWEGHGCHLLRRMGTNRFTGADTPGTV